MAGDPAKRLPFDGRIRHYWVATLANPAAPTVAELTAETSFDLSKYTPKNGMAGEPTENFIESGDITDTFDSQQVGTWAEQPTLELYKQDPDDDAFEFFATTKTGYLVTLWAATATSPEDGDPCYVRHVENHTSKPLPYTTNEKQRFRVGFANIEEPEFAATVTASS